jgi:hypothetical protein
MACGEGGGRAEDGGGAVRDGTAFPSLGWRKLLQAKGKSTLAGVDGEFSLAIYC